MPIREKSFRIGCGRYLQERGAITLLGEEVLRLGTAPLLIGGKRALSVAGQQAEKSVAACCDHYKIMTYTGTCNEEKAQELAAFAKEQGLDVIVGIGGGVIMDFAKLVAFHAELPVINLPTSTATCAAYTPLSVCYTPEGRTVGTRHFEKEVDGVIVDPEILATQPERLLLAGVFDSLAKYLEIRHRYSEEMEEYPLGLDWAYVLAKRSFRELTHKTEKSLQELKRGIISDTAEQLYFTALAATGVISGIARGSNQTALAHKFYEATRELYFEESKQYLHGEIVGVGLLLQNHFTGATEQNRFLLGLMKQYHMPCCPAEIGLQVTPELVERYYEKLKAGSAINEEDPMECQQLRAGLDYLFYGEEV